MIKVTVQNSGKYDTMITLSENFSDVVNTFYNENPRWSAVNFDDGVAKFGFEIKGMDGRWQTENVVVENMLA